ncbi:hypothetical protein ABGT24_09745 [Peribacillus frigoritolerans]|jgi:hypothetical protein|uniref:DUF6843 domain-containing protein n=1 Tax=Peribacillus frigoritolerans TaxID=450367 RepID=UPI00345C6A95
MKRYFFIIISLILIGGCSHQEKEVGTNELYLIPSGFEGTIIVFYDVPNKPVLEKEGKYSVIRVKFEYLEALEGTEIHQYGIYFTSTQDMNYGTVNNKYYYINENGDRTSINEQCTHVMGNGSFTGEDGKEIKYSTIQITKSQCGEAFYLDGKDDYYTQKEEVKSYWMNYFD